ncbi:hypothetical protein ACJIZ3_008690 [Penstemon smallii]|uniref:Transposase-associated domain-containing protein n=1 Tax=Penstemon smallii TaxID=265156 RepID=A0ABD3TAJ2_9LAMI
MSMDRSWIKIRNRMHPDYKKGVEDFLEYAYTTMKSSEVIKCPCTHCQNLTHRNRRGVYEHIMMYGFLKTYSNCVHHGEESFYLSHLNSNDDEDEEKEETYHSQRRIRTPHNTLTVFHSEKCV